jgi:Condensation domain/TubC N-terminal docking domain
MYTAGREITDLDSVTLLANLRRKGAKLWLENGELHCKSPKGKLSSHEMDSLKLHKSKIIAILENATRAAHIVPNLQRRPAGSSVPLAYSQRAHWQSYRLSERRAVRQIASAIRLRESLNVNVLRSSLAETVRRHDALRTRVVVRNGVLVQEVSAFGDCPLNVTDLIGVPADTQELRITELMDHLVIRPIDVAVDPLWEMEIVKLSDRETLLIVVMEHMISDMSSLTIFFREVLGGYRSLMKYDVYSSLEEPPQFSDYAYWQQEGEQDWLTRHSAYWSERLAGCERVRFPADPLLPTADLPGWEVVQFQIDSQFTEELRRWSKKTKVSLATCVFAAYAALVLRWCDVTRAVIQYVADGRSSHKLMDSIGAFAVLLSLRVDLAVDVDTTEFIARAATEYANALEHCDFSYFESRSPRPGFTRGSSFNWIPRHQNDIDWNDGEEALPCTRIDFEHPMLRNLERDTEPFVVLFETEHQINGGVYYPRSRFSAQTMKRFNQNFLLFLEKFSRAPNSRVSKITLI